MLEAAVRGAREEAARLGVTRPRVLGVTVLTSVERRAARAVRPTVMRLARAARQAGCDGIVASAQDAAALRRRFGAGWQIVCPGIRPAHTRLGDQARVASPRQALASGADCLVVGRPITAAPRPRAAAQAILKEMEGVCGC